jgi:hypothetical protein
MPHDVLLDHLERSFGESYRKEIDQEENVWRSLPFFAATLALQLAALAQIRDWVAGIDGGMFVAATTLLGLAGLATLGALAFLAMSVWPADFRRVAREPDFLRYAEQVRADLAAAMPGATADSIAAAALAVVKATLAEQYATAADSNRRVTEKRARFRTLAGLATLASVFAMLVLVGLVVLSNMHGHGHA